MADKPAPQAAGEPRAPTEAEVRELLMRGETLRQQLGTLETQREYLLELLQDARRALATVEHVEKSADGDEVLVPVGAGTYLRASLAHGGEAITSLGSGLHAQLPAKDARERLGERVKNLEEAAGTLGKDVARISEELARINAIAEQIYGG